MPTEAKQDKQEKRAEEFARMNPVQQISIKDIEIDDTFNARETTGLDKTSMDEFAQSIEHGLINPVTVRPTPKGPKAFKLVAGFRRTKAAILLKWQTISATILPQETTEQEARITNVVENIIRDDLSTYEKAKAYVGLLEAGVKQTEIIARLGIGRSQSSVDNLIRIFKNLDPEIKAYWADPKSAVGRRLSFSWLVDIIKYPVRPTKPGEISQRQRLDQLQGENDQASLEKMLKTGEEKGEGGKSKKPAGKFVRIRRDWLTAAIKAADGADLDPDLMAGMTAMLNFVLGRGGYTLRVADKEIWSAKVVKAKAKKGQKKEHGNKKAA